ncbi:MAG: MCE family protein [Acidimicrobiales bacterium]
MLISRRVLINLGVFVAVFGVLCWWAVNNIVSIERLENPYPIDGVFDFSAGLADGSEVTYLGVHAGTVSSVRLQSDGVHIRMQIDNDRDIPARSIARVLRKSAIGEPYIDFQPPEDFDPDAPGNQFLEDGEGIEVPAEQTTVPLEFSEVLRTASEILGNIAPADVNTLIHELAVGLDGRAEDLRRLTEGFDDITSTFAARTDVLDRLAVNNTRLTATLAEHADDLGQSLTNLSELAESLRNAGGDLQRLLDQGPAFLGTTGDLLADTRANVDCLLANLVLVNQEVATPQRLADLEFQLNELPAAFDLIGHAVVSEPDGVWVRVALILNPDSLLGQQPIQYTPPLQLPSVPTPAACPGVTGASTRTAVPAGDFDPASVLGTSSSLPATGTVLALGTVASVLMTAALFLRWTARRPNAEA